MGSMGEEFSFHLSKTSTTHKGRRGCLQTPHGSIETPAFIFCATKASIKGLTPDNMRQAHTQIILSNTYHLMLQPGSKIIDRAGGLHKFMGWSGPMLTDSGGFQIFSLGHGSVSSEIKGRRHSSNSKRNSQVKMTEEGAYFRSYRDGSRVCLTPETSIQIQRDLGADLIVVLDECTPYHVEKSYTRASMERSHRWAIRSYEEFSKPHKRSQALYGIVQGGVYSDLRRESARFIQEQDFFGCAVGGSLGASVAEMHQVVSETLSFVSPSERPIHLLGIGGIADILHGVTCGIDTFDCVHPTRLGRHGGALIPASQTPSLFSEPVNHINLKRSCFAEDFNPIDATCACSTCQSFSRAYIHHLLKSHEILGMQALTQHNVWTMNRLMTEIRTALDNDDQWRTLEHFWLGSA